MLAGPTLTQVKAAIQAKGYGSDTDTAQTQLVNSVYRRVLAMHRWSFLEAQTTSLTTTAGASTVALSTADLLYLSAVRLEDATTASDYELDWWPLQQLRDERHLDRQLDTPEVWSFSAGNVELYPIPDRAYKLTIDYASFPADLANGSDVLAVPRAFEDVIVWGAVVEIAYRQRDWAAMQVAKQQFDERLAEMIRSYAIEQRQTAREVGRWDGWDDVARSAH